MSSPAEIASPSATATESTVPCMGLVTAPVASPTRPLLRARCRRASSAHGGSARVEPDLVQAAVDLDRDDLLARGSRRSSVRERRRARPSMRQLILISCARFASSSDSTTSRQVPAAMKQGVSRSARWNATRVRRPLDDELLERTQHPSTGVLAVDVVHDQLRDERVVEIRDLVAGADAGVDAHADPARLPVGRDPPRRREEAAWRRPRR